MSYFAAGLVRSAGGWTGEEVDLKGVEDVDGVADLLRDLLPEDDAKDAIALLMVEENDEYVAIMRVQGDLDPRVFLSDSRSPQSSDIAAALYDGAPPIVEEEDEDGDSAKPQAEAVGDTTLLADLGTSSDDLLELCGEEGMLPGDIITAICERAGALDVLEGLREG